MLDKHNLSPPLTPGVYLPTLGLPTDFGSAKGQAFSRAAKALAKVLAAPPRRALPVDRVVVSQRGNGGGNDAVRGWTNEE